MALVKCPECGKKVSDSANSCPNCGYGIKDHFERIEKKKEFERQFTKSNTNATVSAKKSAKSEILTPILIIIACVLFCILVLNATPSQSKSSGNALHGEVRCIMCSKVIYNDGRAIHCTHQQLHTYKCDYCGATNIIK